MAVAEAKTTASTRCPRASSLDGVWDLPLLRCEAAGRLSQRYYPGGAIPAPPSCINADYRTGERNGGLLPPRHPPGREAQLDFTHCNSLGVTIGGRGATATWRVLSHGWRYAALPSRGCRTRLGTGHMTRALTHEIKRRWPGPKRQLRRAPGTTGSRRGESHENGVMVEGRSRP